MGRACKCQICGKSLNTDSAYKIHSNNRNLYYCNIEEYEKYNLRIASDKEEKRIVYEKIGELIDVTDNTLLFKNISELHKKYSYKLIYSYLCYEEEMISRAMNKQFTNTYAKIKYFIAILTNNLCDYEIPTENNLYIEHEITETKYKIKNKRRGLQDIEREVLEEIE